MGLLKHTLSQGIQHRWNSIYDMIERLFEQQTAVATVLHNHRDLLLYVRTSRELLHLEHSTAE